MKSFLSKLTLYLSLIFSVSLAADYYEKLPEEFLISYGSKDAPVTLTYLFSIYCPSCLDFIHNDFTALMKKYIDSRKVKWVWHPFPNPSKPLTYQAMLCWGALSKSQKRIFLENCAEHLNEKNLAHATDYFKSLMKFFGHNISDLYSRDFLLQPHAREPAARFISQKQDINIPSIEVNGSYSKRFPSAIFVEKQIQKALENQGEETCVKLCL